MTQMLYRPIEDDSDLWDDSDYDYVPYRDRMPQTDDLTVLREELSLQRELRGPSSSQAKEAFENLFRASCRIGRPLDGLRQFSTVEAERFFALTRKGTDGHVYWLGAKGGFRMNDGRYAKPNRWWWMRENYEVGSYHDIFPECGQRTCIAPDHQGHGRVERRRLYSHEQMIGALQVMQMRLGRIPTMNDWIREGGQPSLRTYRLRFGSWVDSLVAAGIIKSRSEIPRAKPPITSVTPEACIASLHEGRRFMQQIPKERDYGKGETGAKMRAHLRDLGLVSSQTTIKKYLGPWPEAIKKAFGE